MRSKIKNPPLTLNRLMREIHEAEHIDKCDYFGKLDDAPPGNCARFICKSEKECHEESEKRLKKLIQ